MKLVRYGAPGREKPGIIDADGKIRDLSRIVKDIDGAMLASGGLAKIKKANLKRLKAVGGKPRLGPCIGRVRNLHRHRAELSPTTPPRPAMPMPSRAGDLQQGAELHLRAERQHHDPEGFQQARLRDASSPSSSASARAIWRRTRRWTRSPAIAWPTTCRSAPSRWSTGRPSPRARAAETFGPLGPWFVSKDEIKDPQNLAMWLKVNGEKRQHGNTKTMVFDVPHLVWYCSQFFVLEPGDVIVTGTPPGVGLGMKPAPIWLQGRRRGRTRHRRARRAEAEDRAVQGLTFFELYPVRVKTKKPRGGPPGLIVSNALPT